MQRTILLVLVPLAFLAGGITRSLLVNHGVDLVPTMVGTGVVWVFCWMLWLLGSVFNPFKGRRESLFD